MAGLVTNELLKMGFLDAVELLKTEMRLVMASYIVHLEMQVFFKVSD